MTLNELTREIIGAAIDVHRAFGPGLLESVYEECMAMELGMRGLPHERQSALPIVYKGHFNVPVLSAGVKRLVNSFDDSASPRLGGES